MIWDMLLATRAKQKNVKEITSKLIPKKPLGIDDLLRTHAGRR